MLKALTLRVASSRLARSVSTCNSSRSSDLRVSDSSLTSSLSQAMNALDQCVPDLEKRSGNSTPLLWSRCLMRVL